ncbi:hypothetical protein TNCV_1589441 [Trichonephila clavipes]|uniref:Uncharacterized protein n=1 Tax=Trichonephila clavipes TaxID=2585209 RepID=A0A8X6V421_TRICX|nr:hypothetical protein TNCV_1589441 [Trichonephila clavipes]
MESVPEPDEISNVIEEVVDLARQINLEVDSDDVQELLDSHNQELPIEKMHEQNIEELQRWLAGQNFGWGSKLQNETDVSRLRAVLEVSSRSAQRTLKRTLEVVKAALTTSLKEIPVDDFQGTFNGCVKRWQRCIESVVINDFHSGRSLVVNGPDMSLVRAQVPLKTSRVEELMCIKSVEGQSSLWRRVNREVPAQMSSSSLNPNSKLRGPSPIPLVLLNSATSFIDVHEV